LTHPPTSSLEARAPAPSPSDPPHRSQLTEGNDVVCEMTVDMHPRTVHVTQGLTALTARLANLRLTCTALATAGVPHFLVPGLQDLASAVGVREEHRGSAIKALDALLAEHPGYISTVIPRPRSATQPSPGNHKASWARHGAADVLLLT